MLGFIISSVVASVVMLLITMMPMTVGVTRFFTPCPLLIPLGLLSLHMFLHDIEKALVMFGMLEEVFCHHPIAR